MIEVLFPTNLVLGIAGECNSVEGDSRGEHKHHWKSFPRPSISGQFSFSPKPST